MKKLIAVLILFLAYGCDQGLENTKSRDAIEKTDSVYTALYTKVNDDLTELFLTATEVTNARDGETNLLAKENAQDAVIDALEAGSGALVSATDTTVGYLNGKLLAGTGITFAVGSPAANETLTLNVTAQSAANETTSGILETASDAEAIARTATNKIIVPSNFLELFKIKEYYLIPVEWAEDGVTSTAEASALYTSTNGKVRAREFADDSTEDIVFAWMVPDDIVAASGIKFKVKCLVVEATGPSAEGVAFLLSGYSSGAGDSINGTYGTQVESLATGRTDSQYDLFDTTLSNAVTVTNLAAGELAMFKLERDHDHASDTYGQDLGVVSVTILYTAYKAAP